MLHLANELIDIQDGLDYNVRPVSIGSTSGNRSYTQEQITHNGTKVGRGLGPVIEIDIIRPPSGAVTLEVWAHDMDLTQAGILYPVSRFTPAKPDFCGTTILKDFYFRKLSWLDGDGVPLIAAAGAVVGKRLKLVPNQYNVNVT